MIRNILSLFLLLSSFSMFGQYNQTTVFDTLSGQPLLDSLVANYKIDSTKGYGPAKDTLFSKIYPLNDSLHCVYSGFKRVVDTSQDPTTYFYDNGSALAMNAEHTFPQSKGAGSNPAKSDMHHLFPTKAIPNTGRGHKPFAELSDNSVTKWYYQDQVFTTAPSSNRDLCGKLDANAELFEPPEAHKGNVARAMFYFYTMYKQQADAADPTFFSSQTSTLCAWHLADPVDSLEWVRSNLIADHQDGKANPFVLDCTLAGRTYCSNQSNCASTSQSSVEDAAAWGLELFQNSPNPVENTTMISYKLHQPQQVTLTVYNVLGEAIETLVDAPQNVGLHSYEWSTQNLAAGLYSYQLTLQNKGKTKSFVRKMVVVR
ncbi:MAG: T9SS type A sorting domain-containing protein [Aureispira sp.]|nr:T9SS type A sorting domain-containing protein [Aureispira sp.]